MTVKKAAVKKPVKKRIDVFTKVYFGVGGKRFNRGDKCEVQDADELEKLLELNAIKSIFAEV